MLSIFSIPKPFVGHIGVIQRNAIKSWLILEPKCEIILLGDEKGIKEISEEFGIVHIPNIAKNEFGTPLLNDIFAKISLSASFKDIAFVNSDIILLSDFLEAFKMINFPSFVMVSRRWELDIKEDIDFKSNGEEKIRQLLIKKGRLFSHSGIDYFIFKESFPSKIPPFILGRSGGYDSWLLYHANSLGIPIVDVTKVTSVIHQYHENASYVFQGSQGPGKKIETKRNLKLGGGFLRRMTIRDAGWQLTKEGLIKKKKNPFYQNIYRYSAGLLAYYPFFNFWYKILFSPIWLLAKTLQEIRDLCLKKGKFWLK